MKTSIKSVLIGEARSGTMLTGVVTWFRPTFAPDITGQDLHGSPVDSPDDFPGAGMSDPQQECSDVAPAGASATPALAILRQQTNCSSVANTTSDDTKWTNRDFIPARDSSTAAANVYQNLEGLTLIIG